MFAEFSGRVYLLCGCIENVGILGNVEDQGQPPALFLTSDTPILIPGAFSFV